MLFIFLSTSIILLVVRDYIFASFIPALLCFCIIKHKWIKLSKPLYLFLGLFTLSFVVLTLLSFIYPSYNIFQYLAENQSYFLKHVHGTSNYSITPIDGTALSFLVHTPRAFLTALINPEFTDIGRSNTILRLLSVIENFCVIGLVVYRIVRSKILELEERNILWMVVFFSVSLLILLGLVVNNLGALYRYKSNLLPLLIPVLIGANVFNQKHLRTR